MPIEMREVKLHMPAHMRRDSVTLVYSDSNSDLCDHVSKKKRGNDEMKTQIVRDTNVHKLIDVVKSRRHYSR